MQSLQSRTWLAVRGKTPEAALADLGLRAGMAVTRRGRFAIEGARSDAGWYLIVASGWNHRLIAPDVLATLGAGCEVVTCTADERNLASAAAGWTDGRQIWALRYEGEDHPGEVVVEGNLPPAVATIRQEFIEKSQSEDAGDLLLDPLFEMAIAVVQRETDYRPDEPSPAFDGRFVMLEAVNPTIYQRLFGG